MSRREGERREQKKEGRKEGGNKEERREGVTRDKEMHSQRLGFILQ